MKVFTLAIVATAIHTNVALAESSTTTVSQSEFRADAKITEPIARNIALSQVPKGTVKSIKRERGKRLCIWSVDLAGRDTKNITEVGIDATTGAIVAFDIKTPREQESEKDEGNNKYRRLIQRSTELNVSA